YEDTAQRLWIVQPTDLGTYITLLDLKTNSIKSFDEVFKDKVPFTNKDIDYIYSNAVNDIFISTEKGNIYRYRDNRFEHIFTIPDPALRTALYTNERYLWIQLTAQEGKEKVLKISLRDQAVEEIELPGYTETIGIDKNDALWLFQSRQKKLLCTSNGKDGLKTIDLRSFELPEAIYKTPDFREYRLNPSDGLIWWWRQQKDQKAFFVLHPREGMIYNLQPEVASLLTYETPIRNIYFDTENRAWAATQDGIFIITLKKNKFTILLSGQPETYSVRGIIKDSRGTLHICTYNGSMQLSPEGDIIKKDKNMRWFCAAADNRGNLWFGTGNGRIEKYDPLSGQSQYYTYPSDAPYPAPWAQWAIIRDKTGRVWAGARNGLYFLEPRTGLYRKFTRHKAFPQLEESSINHLYETKEGIWMATSSGLYFMEPGKDITVRYAAGEKPPRRVPYDYLLHCYRDKTGIFWLAAKGGGLVRFDPDTGISRQFTTADGLSSNIIYAVYEDDYGKLWLPSNYGLMQFDKESHRVNTYLKNDGIAHNEFNTASHYRTIDGRLCFGGLSGITVFHPKDFAEESAVQVPLQLTACQVLDGKTGALTDKTTAVTTTGALALSPSDKSLIIEFALLNYENISKNNYAYTLEGLDKVWTPLRSNSLRINALPYGSYVLRIKGQGIKGEQSVNDLTINLFVRKPFYLKRGFIISCILASGLLIYGIFRWRLKSLAQAKLRLREMVKQRTREIQKQKNKIEKDKNTIEQQAVKLKALDSAKSRFFANISHELRTPLTLILGHLQATLGGKYGTIGQRVRDNLEVSHSNSRRLLGMIEEILDLSKMEAGKLELHNKPVRFYPLLDRLCDTFRSYLKGKNVR
ncbi:MAG: hypothetical protein KDD04_03585, partial [Sinomicrobium sp.]|nr:hypothetical protein [Sinomicrobium sp.]